MARATESDGFAALLLEALEPLGGISLRRMFGGAGIFSSDLMFALVSDDKLYLKVDSSNQSLFEAEGLQPFAYQRRDGRTTVMSFWSAPERLLDEPDELRQWAERSILVARRKANDKPAKPRSVRRRD